MKLIHGDCVEEMRVLSAASVDAVVCDGPYGIGFMGKEFDTFRPEETTRRADRKRRKKTDTPEGAHGRPGELGTSGIEYDRTLAGNRAFQAWNEAWAREALRVLKPGGHILAFGGTRTFHRLACAIEDAGFEIRDSILDGTVPLLAWCYGSGFPKSLDVSGAIDMKACREELTRKLGREPTKEEFKAAWKTFREVVGENPNAKTGAGWQAEYVGGKVDREGTVPITAPATPEAARWEGWGTALKPAWEPVIMARKPLGRNALDIVQAVEYIIRESGFQGEIRWVQRPVKTAEKRSLPRNSTETKPRTSAAGTSARRASGSGTRPTANATGRNCESEAASGTRPTRNEALSTGGNTQEGSGKKPSTPTAESAPAAGNPDTNSSPSTISAEAARNTGGRSDRTSSEISKREGSRKGSGSSAGIAIAPWDGTDTALTVIFEGEEYRIEWLPDGSLIWPESLPKNRPAQKLSVAENVLEHGTGGINVGTTRIGTEATQRKNHGGTGNIENWRTGARPCETGSPEGRWPANVVLSHTPDCRCVGARKVKGITGGNSKNISNKVYGKYNDEADGKPCGYTDASGRETVEKWECVPDCPVRLLDEQSGESRSSPNKGGGKITGQVTGFPGYDRSPGGFGDSGGASRFFYCAKASRWEREAGLKGLPERREYGTFGDGLGNVPEIDGQRPTPARNHHPTVKPVALMRWLVRLVTPPGGTVLDPFMGSGTTGMACVLEGFEFIGIEKEWEYLEIADRRIDYARANPRAFEGERPMPTKDADGQTEMFGGDTR